MRNRRMVAAFLSVCLILSLTPVSAYAGEDGTLSGSGIEEDPYVITSVTDLQKVSENMDACYVLDENLDIGGEWTSIVGTFTGHFDGAGHRITGITGFGEDGAGLFSTLSGATISRLTVCTDGTVETEQTAGLLAGEATDTALIDCGAEGSISRSGNGVGIAGLLCGTFSGTIQRCWAVGTVYAGGVGLSSATAYGGGFAGNFSGNTAVEDSYALVHVTALAVSGFSENDYAGGIAGYISADSTADFKRCYVVGRIFHGDNHYAGDAYIDSCGQDATVTTEDCPYNGQLSEIEGGLDTGDMLDVAAYPDFDFDTIWEIDASNGGYPYLCENLPTYDTIDLLCPWALSKTPESDNCAQSTTLTQTFTFDRKVELGNELSYFVNTADASDQLSVELTILNDGYAVKAENIEKAAFNTEYSLIVPEGSIKEVRTGGYAFGGFENGDYNRRVMALPFSGGSGTESDPYIILTEAQLTSIRTGLDQHYILGADIVMDHPYQIGSSSEPFTGSLDGDGHSITGITGYFINTDYPNNQSISPGLFRYAENATIENLTLSGDITFFNNNYSSQDAALLVTSGTGLTLRNIHVSGSIVRSYTSVSGLLCARLTNSTVAYCSAEGTLGSATYNQQPSGGLAGYATNCTFTDCWADVDLHGSYVRKNTLNYLGGISGVSISSSYRNCLVTGSLIYSPMNRFNGTVAPIANSVVLGEYNAVVSTPALDAENCYYCLNQVTDGTLTSDTAQATALSAEQLKIMSNFSGFNFYEVWDMNAEIRNGYPYLNLRQKNIENDDIDAVFPVSGSESVSYSTDTAAVCTVTFSDDVKSLAEAPQKIFEIYEANSDIPVATLHKVDCTLNGKTVSFLLDSIGSFLSDNKNYEIRMPMGAVCLNNGNQPYIGAGEWTFHTTAAKTITFQYRGADDKSDKTEECSYSDAMFEKSAFVYSPDLTETSLCLAMSGFNSADAKEYADKSIHVKEFLNSAGFNHLSVNNDYQTKPGLDTMGVAVGQKQLIQGDEPVTLIAVVLRGSGYENEWGGNFTLGNNGSYHLGFQTARNEALKTLEQYMKENNVTGKVKFWITGYSRSAATANLTAGALVDYSWNYSGIEYTNKDVYAYCFEPPAGRIFNAEEQNGYQYNCIKNIINPCDVVPMLAPSYFKFGRYGIDLYLPGPSTALNFPDTLSAVKQEYDKISGGDTFGYMNGQEAFLSDTVNKVSQNIKSLDNYVYNYQPAMRTKVPEFFSNEKIVEAEGIPRAIITVVVDNIIVPSINDAATKGNFAGPEAVLTASKYSLITSFKQNYDNIKHAHFPEVTLAWVRTVNEADYSDGQYRLVRVNCPVTVEVYQGSTLVASITEDGAQDISGSSIGAWVDDNGQMVIALPWDAAYSVKMTATDNGTVSYSTSECSFAYGTTRVLNYYDVPVEAGDVLIGTIENAESVGEESTESTYELTSSNLKTVILPPEDIQGDAVETCSVTLHINGNGAVVGQSAAQKGEFVRLTAVSDADNRFVGWYKNGTQISKDAEYRFCLKENCELTAVFSPTASGKKGGASDYTLTFQTNGGGTIPTIYKTNETIDLSTYKPTRDGYSFAGWYADSALSTKVTSVNLTANTTVYAKWAKQETEIPFVNMPEVEIPFADVPKGSFYYDAVLWSIDNNVAAGTSETTFSPDAICTRAQAVTFLWHANGSPEPTGSLNRFADVRTDDVYVKAVAWAVEQGITNGTSTTTFSPNDTVTRAQVMSFLWRLASKPAAKGGNPFTDVPSGTYYETAVEWAVEQNITSGTGVTTFNPSDGCTRSQIITFLYRHIGEKD